MNRTILVRTSIRTAALAVVLPALFLAPPTASGRSRRITFRSAVDVPEQGLRLPVPQGAQPTTPTPVEIFTYRDRDGRTFEARDPAAFWHASQRQGQWDDGRGTRLTLATPTRLFPGNWPRRHVTMAEFDRGMKDAGVPTTLDEFGTWVETFSGAPIEGDPVELRPPPRLAVALLIRFQPSEPARVGVAFRLRTSARQSMDGGWFFVLFEFEAPVDLETVVRDLSHSFLAGINVVPQSADPAPSPRFQVRPVDGDRRSAAFQASRQRAIDSIRGRPGWWFVETPNYVLVTDLRAIRARVVRQIQADAEILRTVFSRWIPPLAPIEAVSVIRIFSDGGAYEAHVGSDLAWSGGAWMPGRGELVIRARDWGSPREQHAWLLGTVYHEAFHQYLFYAMGGRRIGVWFNEGHATLFEGVEIRGDRVRIHEVPRYAETADRIVAENRLNVSELLNAGHSEFYEAGGHDRQRHENYARAWVLVYYLRAHAAQDPRHPHAGLPARYVAALGRGQSPPQAWFAALEAETPEALEQAVRRFWQSPSARRAARRFDAAGAPAP